MPTLGAALDFAKLEGRNLRAHQLGAAPSSPVTGQLYYNTGDNTLYWWDGSAWQSAKGGAGGPPSGSAGGDLTGSYPNPQIAAGVIVDADVNAGAAIATTKLSPNPLARANHTGTQLAATISDFDTQVRTSRLDQMAAPTGALSINSQRLTAVADPSAATDGANKQYVDNLVQGLDAAASCKAATTANIANLAGGAPNTLDGVTLAANDRVLVKDQTTTALNGIYTVTTLGTGANGTWTRATDMDAWTEVPSTYTWVEQGTVNADTGWVCTADQGGTLGSTAITWVQFAAAGTAIAGAGLTKTGNTFDVGAGSGITVNADNIQIANNGVTNAMIADGAIALNTADVTGALPIANGGTGATTAAAARTALGDAGYYSSATHGAGTTITVTAATHGLRATRGLIVQCQDEATGAVELPDISVAANGDVTVTYSASVSANSKRVTVIG